LAHCQQLRNNTGGEKLRHPLEMTFGATPCRQFFGRGQQSQHAIDGARFIGAVLG